MKQVGKAVGKVHDELRILKLIPIAWGTKGKKWVRKAEEASVDNFIF